MSLASKKLYWHMGTSSAGTTYSANLYTDPGDIPVSLYRASAPKYLCIYSNNATYYAAIDEVVMGRPRSSNLRLGLENTWNDGGNLVLAVGNHNYETIALSGAEYLLTDSEVNWTVVDHSVTASAFSVATKYVSYYFDSTRRVTVNGGNELNIQVGAGAGIFPANMFYNIDGGTWHNITQFDPTAPWRDVLEGHHTIGLKTEGGIFGQTAKFRIVYPSRVKGVLECSPPSALLPI